MSIKEIETAIQAFKIELAEPGITDAQREHFEDCLATANAKLTALTSPSTQPPAATPSFRQETAAGRFGKPAPAAFVPQPAAHAQAPQGQGSVASSQPPTADGAEKKKTRSAPSAAPTASIRSSLGNGDSPVFEAALSIPDSRFTVRFTLRDGKVSDIVCTPGEAASKVRQNLSVAARLKKKELGQSHCFYRAKVYLNALEWKAGRPMTAQDVGLKKKHGATLALFEQIQAEQSAR